MTASLRLSHDIHVLVCDAQKALLMRNAGDATHPNLVVEHEFEAPANPASREHVSDGPGKHPNLHGPSSAMETADSHQRAEDAFITETAHAVSRLCTKNGVDKLVVVAPPRALAALREALDDSTRRRIVAEIGKDLTKHPVHEIERLLTA